MATCEYHFGGAYCTIMQIECDWKRSANYQDCVAWDIEQRKKNVKEVEPIPEEIKRMIDGDMGLVRRLNEKQN